MQVIHQYANQNINFFNPRTLRILECTEQLFSLIIVEKDELGNMS
jgi:hypothetical protein